MKRKLRTLFPAVLLLLLAVLLLTPVPWTKARSARYGENGMLLMRDIDAQIRLVNHIDSCKASEIDALLQHAYAKGAFSGQVLYAENGKVLYNQCFGYSDIRYRRDSIKPESRFQLASLSKPFTAVAVMQLYQEGQLDIYAPVQKYLKNFPYENITVKDLLQHRSGIRNYIYIADRYWGKKEPMSNADITPLLKKYAPRTEFTPGSRFKYCNSNYAYLAEIVESVTGKTFAEYFETRIARPLGMTHTFVYDARQPQTDNIVKGYSYARRRGFYQRHPDYLDGVVGDKGLYSTVEDIFLFDQALYSRNFLDDSILDLMFTPAEPVKAGGESIYGMGFRVKQDTGGYQYVFHNGWWKGFRTYFTHDYQNHRTLIWLCNRSDVTVGPYIDEIFRISNSYGPSDWMIALKQREENIRKDAQFNRLPNVVPEEENTLESRLLKKQETYGSK